MRYPIRSKVVALLATLGLAFAVMPSTANAADHHTIIKQGKTISRTMTAPDGTTYLQVVDTGSCQVTVPFSNGTSTVVHSHADMYWDNLNGDPGFFQFKVFNDANNHNPAYVQPDWTRVKFRDADGTVLITYENYNDGFTTSWTKPVNLWAPRSSGRNWTVFFSWFNAHDGTHTNCYYPVVMN